MSKSRKTISLQILMILAIGVLYCTNLESKSPAAPYLGRWALYPQGGAGWLEIRQEEDYIDADMLWYGGSVVPVASVLLKEDALVVTRNGRINRKRDADGKVLRYHTLTSWYEFKPKNDDELLCTAYLPDGRSQKIEVQEFIAKRIPPLPPAPDLTKVKYGDPIELFNGKDLAGWQLVENNRTNGFKAADGMLVNDPVQEEGKPHVSYGNIRTVDEFEDFNLKLQVNIPQRQNSGIYLRGIYEVQVEDTYGRPLDSHNMGAIYSRITPSVAAEKPAGEWQDLDITLCDRHVTVVLNGTTIIDNQPVLGVTGGALTADEFSPGPIYLQGDHGKVMYRNIVLTPILK